MKKLIETRVNRFELKTNTGLDQAMSRIEIFGADNAGMECDLEKYKMEASQIMMAIRAPSMRLDSCGVVFLSEEPFIPETINKTKR